MKQKISVLIIEDTLELWRSITRAIKILGLPFEVAFAENYIEAIGKIDNLKPELIICDYFLPDWRNGLEVWKYCKNHCPLVPFLIISGMSADQYVRSVSGYDSYPAFLSKPFSLEELAVILTELVSDQCRQHRAA